MNIDINLIRQTERLHYDYPTCGVLIDTFHNGSHWHAAAICRKRRTIFIMDLKTKDRHEKPLLVY